MIIASDLPRRRRPRTPRGCTNFKLRQLTRRVSRTTTAIVGARGAEDDAVLAAVARRCGSARSGRATWRAAMELDASTLTRNLQPLVAQGWVEVGPGADARCAWSSLTDAGRAKRAEAQREWKRAQLALNERLGAARVAAAARAARRLPERARTTVERSPR